MVTLVPPCAHGVLGIPHGKVCDNNNSRQCINEFIKAQVDWMPQVMRNNIIRANKDLKGEFYFHNNNYCHQLISLEKNSSLPLFVVRNWMFPTQIP